MNKEKLDNLWEACRDGSISESDRALFENHLRESESAAAMWQAESQWLILMGDIDGAMAEEPAVADGSAFAMSVIEQWQSQQEREALGVIATIGPATSTRSLRRFAGMAAMIALFIGAAIYVGIITSQQPATEGGGSVVVNPPISNQNETAPEAIGLLLTSAKESFAVASAQPARLRQGLADTAAMFDVANLASLLDPGVPDPAAFVTPANGG